VLCVGERSGIASPTHVRRREVGSPRGRAEYSIHTVVDGRVSGIRECERDTRRGSRARAAYSVLHGGFACTVYGGLAARGACVCVRMGIYTARGGGARGGVREGVVSARSTTSVTLS
jgi:hypothetical protein